MKKKRIYSSFSGEIVIEPEPYPLTSKDFEEFIKRFRTELKKFKAKKPNKLGELIWFFISIFDILVTRYDFIEIPSVKSIPSGDEILAQIEKEVKVYQKIGTRDGTEFFKESIRLCFDNLIREWEEIKLIYNEIRKRKLKEFQEILQDKTDARRAVLLELAEELYKKEGKIKKLIKKQLSQSKGKIKTYPFNPLFVLSYKYWMERMSFLIKAYVMLYLRSQLEKSPQDYIKDLWIAFNQADIKKKSGKILKLMEALESISLRALINEYRELVSPFFREHIISDLYEESIKDKAVDIFIRRNISRKELYPVIFQQYLKIWHKATLSDEDEFGERLIKVRMKAGKLSKNRDYFKDFIIVSYYPVLISRLKDKKKITRYLNDLKVFKITESYLNKMVSIYGYGYLGGEKENFVMRAGLLPPNPIPDKRGEKIIDILTSSRKKRKKGQESDRLLLIEPEFRYFLYCWGKSNPWEDDYYLF